MYLKFVKTTLLRSLRTSALVLGLILIGIYIFGQYFLKAEKNYLSMPGDLVTVWHENMPVTVHLHCSGPKTKNPTVLLESGAMGWSSSWWEVRETLSKHHRVCGWDRPGMGWSPPPLVPIAVRDYSSLYQKALEQSKEKGHYVLVGHSMGSLFLWDFAQKFPSQVQAFLMVDPAHPKQFHQLPQALVQETTERLELLKWGPSMASLGILRWIEPPILSIRSLPFPWQQPMYHFANSSNHLSQSYKELLQWEKTWPALLKIKQQFDWPLVVLSVEHRASSPEWTQAWRDLHQELTTISSNGKMIIVPGVDHQGVLFTSEGSTFVSREIEQLTNPPTLIGKR